MQETGTTIVQVSPSGTVGTFANVGLLPTVRACPGGTRLTTALPILPGGWVTVGRLPTSGRGALPSENPVGCLVVPSRTGQVAETWSNAKINGPWGMFAVMKRSGGDLFVSNALSGPKGLTKTPPVGLRTVVRMMSRSPPDTCRGSLARLSSDRTLSSARIGPPFSNRRPAWRSLLMARSMSRRRLEQYSEDRECDHAHDGG